MKNILLKYIKKLETEKEQFSKIETELYLGLTNAYNSIIKDLKEILELYFGEPPCDYPEPYLSNQMREKK